MTDTQTSTLEPPIALFDANEDGPAPPRLSSDPQYVRIRWGVYAVRTDWQALKPWERYLTRVHAYARVRPDAVFCAESAAVLLGLPVFDEPRDIHVFDSRRTASLRFADVCVHTSRDRRASHQRGHLLTTTPADTVIDLVKVLPPAFGLAVADAALSPAFALDATYLAFIADARVESRGRRRARWVLDNADGASESPAESISRAVIEWWGLERPELQVVFHNEGHTDRTDFYWRRIRLLGECDGEAKYGDDPVQARRAILREKSREDRLRRHEGPMTRWGWVEAVRAAPLRDRLLFAGVRQVRPPQHALLATLRSNPRSRPLWEEEVRR